MPFVSKRQQRAAFAGALPGIDKEKAKEWAAKTDFSKIPERASSQKGKPTLRKEAAKASPSKLRYMIQHLKKALGNQASQVDTHKNLYEAVQAERERQKRSMDFFAKQAFSVPKPGQAVSNPTQVGAFKGKTTTNFLKPPGPAASAHVINPRKTITNVFKKTL